MTHMHPDKEQHQKTVKVNLHQSDPRFLFISDGKYYLDEKEVSSELAISALVLAVKELGYWGQVAKDILPEEWFQEVQRAYKYHDEGK